MITGIVLAGGKSTRVGQNKLLMPINGKALLLSTIDSLRPFVDKLVVVTGRYHDEILPRLKGVQVVYNADYEKGMFSSVLAGVRKAVGNFFIIPGDCPFVSEETYKALLASPQDFSIRVPTFMGECGHPLYLHKSMKILLLKENAESNLRYFRDFVGYQCVSVTDQNILNDIDTMENIKSISHF